MKKKDPQSDISTQNLIFTKKHSINTFIMFFVAPKFVSCSNNCESTQIMFFNMEVVKIQLKLKGAMKPPDSDFKNAQGSMKTQSAKSKEENKTRKSKNFLFQKQSKHFQGTKGLLNL